MLVRFLLIPFVFLTGCAAVSDIKETTSDVEELVKAPKYYSVSDKELNAVLPDWAIEELKRESNVSSAQNLELGDDHKFSLLAELNTEPVWNEDVGYWSFEVNHKGDSPFECFVLTGDFEPLNRLVTLQEVVLGWYMREGITIESKAILRSGAHVQGNIPVAGLDSLYYMEEEGESVIAMTQGQVAYQNEHTLGCVNADFGYRESFNTLFSELVESWELKSDETLKPYFREVYIASLDGNSMGFVDLSYSKDSDGDTVFQGVSSFMISPDPSTITTSDNYDLEYSTPDGYLINAFSSEVADDQLEKSLSLNQAEEEGWVVEGKLNGKSVTFDISDDVYPRSSLGHYQINRALLKEEEGATVDYIAWVESADPSKFITTTLELNKKEADNNQIAVGMGPLKFNTIVNDAGSSTSFSFRMGDSQIGYRLEVSEGEVE